jgi:uncharacterized protein YbaR (Trm112 family)
MQRHATAVGSDAGRGAVIAIMGRLTLTTERRPGEVICPACDRAYRLRLTPPVAD